MPISFDDSKKIFKLDTPSSTYAFKVYDENYLIHLYYGAYVPDNDFDGYEKRRQYASFSASNAHLTHTGFSVI